MLSNVFWSAGVTGQCAHPTWVISTAQVFVSSPQKRRHSLDFLPELNPKEIELLVLDAGEKNGQMNRRRAIGNEQLLVGNHALLDSHDVRSRADWFGAVDNLVSLNLWEDLVRLNQQPPHRSIGKFKPTLH
jgi:hypothetical protein